MKFNLNYNIISIIVISKAYVYGIPSYHPAYASPSIVSSTIETSVASPTPAGSGKGDANCHSVPRPTKCYHAVPPPPPPPVKCRPAVVFSTSVISTIEPTIKPEPATTSYREPEPTVSIPNIDPLIECYLAYHNNARKEVGVPPLTWDPKLAESATAYSITLYNRSPDDIDLEHSDLDVGENLYASYKKSKNGKYSGNASCEKGMQGWLDEKPLYTPGTGYSNGNGYGHYTQMVNRAVTKVGCGADTKTGMYLTCHYDKIQRSGKPAF